MLTEALRRDGDTLVCDGTLLCRLCANAHACFAGRHPEIPRGNAAQFGLDQFEPRPEWGTETQKEENWADGRNLRIPPEAGFGGQPATGTIHSFIEFELGGYVWGLSGTGAGLSPLSGGGR